ncbi:hypothetical protein PN499_17725 [Kamptonema animale CS-326]|nr:hypothetical protein [Kamptonema animale CS-326]
MEQEALWDFLNLQNKDSAPTIKLRDLIELTKALIINELVSCGHLEEELIEFQLQYQISSEESQKPEIGSVKWSYLPESEQATKSKHEVFEEQPKVNLVENSSEVHERIGKLTERLGELMAASDEGTLTSTRVKFKTLGSSGKKIDCWRENGSDKCYEAYIYYNNQNVVFHSWHRVNGQRISCVCDDPNPNSPIP